MQFNGHMKKTFILFLLLTPRKEEQMWNRPHSLGIKLHTFHNCKWQVMEEVQDTTLIQTSTHISLNHIKWM